MDHWCFTASGLAGLVKMPGKAIISIWRKNPLKTIYQCNQSNGHWIAEELFCSPDPLTSIHHSLSAHRSGNHAGIVCNHYIIQSCPHFFPVFIPYPYHLSIHSCIFPYFVFSCLLHLVCLSNLFIHLSFYVGLLLYLPIFLSFLPSGPILYLSFSHTMW